MDNITRCYERFLREVKASPFPSALLTIHEQFRVLVKERFLVAPWLHAHQLAVIAQYAIAFARPARPRGVNLAALMNAFKDLWFEIENTIQIGASDAVFVIRFVHQQLPFINHVEQLYRSMRRTERLCTAIRAEIQAGFGLSPTELINTCEALFPLFKERCAWSEHLLARTVVRDPEQLARVLRVFSEDRAGFLGRHNKRIINPAKLPYELNPLLTRPLLRFEGQYYAPYPELILHVAGRGLLFRIASDLQLQERLGSAFQDYVGEVLRSAIGKVLSEAEERDRGYTGSNSDWSWIIGDAVVLVECKFSALYRSGKESGSIEQVREDIRKNLADASNPKKGLFQLKAKADAVLGDTLPRGLRAEYASVKRVFSVVLLHDQLHYANSTEVLRGLLDAELDAAGAKGFDYQVWHVEEMENMLEMVSKDELLLFIEQKFNNPEIRTWDLNTVLKKRTGLPWLVPLLVLPREGTPAGIKLRELSRAVFMK